MSRLMPYPGPGPARRVPRPAQMAAAAVLAVALGGCAQDVLHDQAPNVQEIQHTQYPNFAPDKTERPPVLSPDDRKKLESELETLAKSRAGKP